MRYNYHIPAIAHHLKPLITPNTYITRGRYLAKLPVEVITARWRLTSRHRCVELRGGYGQLRWFTALPSRLEHRRRLAAVAAGMFGTANGARSRHRRPPPASPGRQLRHQVRAERRGERRAAGRPAARFATSRLARAGGGAESAASRAPRRDATATSSNLDVRVDRVTLR